MSEKRANERINLLEFQPVLDAGNGKVLGYLGDLSPHGIKLLSKKPIPRGEPLRLRLQYVTFGGGAESLEIDVAPVWQRDDDRAFVETGLRLEDPSAEVLAAIERIVEDLRARDAR